MILWQGQIKSHKKIAIPHEFMQFRLYTVTRLKALPILCGPCFLAEFWVDFKQPAWFHCLISNIKFKTFEMIILSIICQAGTFYFSAGEES